jgi:hypothetical protein
MAMQGDQQVGLERRGYSQVPVGMLQPLPLLLLLPLSVPSTATYWQTTATPLKHASGTC